MSTTASSPGSIASNFSTSNTNNDASASSEENLRRQLRSALQSLNRREPLDSTYKRLLTAGTLSRRSPVIPKDKFYRRISSQLRQRVEIYMQEMEGKDPFDRISQRKPLEETAMRAAFTLREAKEHEQVPLLEATLAQQAMHPERKRHMDGIALGLQQTRQQQQQQQQTAAAKKRKRNIAEHTEQARRTAELERQRKQAQQWEEARRKRQEEEEQRRIETERLKKQQDDPQVALHKIIEPVFKKLWDMEFTNLGGTNPFRIVIDRDNCASMGAPDYLDIISTPMNLTYIQSKVQKMQYSTLQSFFADVDLMINNALLYNSDPGNPYRVAAEEMGKRHNKIVKRVWQQIQQRQQK